MSETLVTLLEQLIAHQNAIQVRFPEPTFPAPPWPSACLFRGLK
ncbi:Uncharacterised protein [Serratia fonticola]|uniref:Uncharacterized protein n=1 Tax=Serratia fonticola TaxID=47917 RepID=A0A4V6KPV8_SERFO|nr:Uncharacterised protein [Serratia fonticola]